MPTIAITGASGKLGGATLGALLEHNLAPAHDIVALTSSAPGSPTWAQLASRGVQVRHASFDAPPTFAAALRGVDRFFLVSTPRIGLDFGDAPEGQGRERHHQAAIDAAVACGVGHVYYSSLAFGYRSGTGPSGESKAGVMRAHLRTERYLEAVAARGGIKTTVLREGLYNESWPLYLGYYDPRGGDDRGVVKLAGDGKVCWTGIRDLGIANALVLTAGESGEEETYAGRTFYLSTRPEGARSVSEIAGMVGEARGKEVRVEVVGREGHERHYVEERGMERPAVEWWASTYEALEDGECLIDDPMLERLLAKVGVKPTPVEETVESMVKG
ncbi:NAD(P)-binding protein [Xylariaceae sp. FL0016]|nr:NAD(P)-binding protein [Xylariaceae sp. FL0016]